LENIKGDYLRDVNGDKVILLKWILGTSGGFWIGLICARIRAGFEFLIFLLCIFEVPTTRLAISSEGLSADKVTLGQSLLRVQQFYPIFKYNQQDATLYNILYYYQCSTCFRQFLRPSSGAQNSTHSIWYMSTLLAATASGSSKKA
jgi:hypothetical protein